tara:strand:+ start:497 stop:898 length:402 start_codon:yes stop_codon:yes gene_type:complete
MDIKEYCEEASKTAVYEHSVDDFIDGIAQLAHDGLNPPDEFRQTLSFMYASLGLAGESGEIANKAKKIIRDDGGVISDEKKAQFEKELGDVLWYWSECVRVLGLDPESVMRANIEKLKSRADRGTLAGEGDNR